MNNKTLNTPSRIEYAMPAVQEAASGLSVFALQIPLEQSIYQDGINRRDTFSAFINSRQQYLTKLKSLGDNWISGSSKQPTEQSLQVSKNLLAHLEYWYSKIGHKDFVYPKLIMGPTPAGGVGIEIEVFPEMRAFINIFNDTIEYEVEKNGHYIEQVVDKDSITNSLLALYNTKETGYIPESQTMTETY